MQLCRSVTGITAWSLLFTVQDVYSLVAVARDDHSPDLLTGTAAVIVHVTDVNDNAPIFIAPPAAGAETNASGTAAMVTLSTRVRPGSSITRVSSRYHRDT